MGSINGLVVVAESGLPLKNLRISASFYESNRATEESSAQFSIGSDLTDSTGKFEIEVDELEGSKNLPRNHFTLILNVFGSDKAGEQKERLIFRAPPRAVSSKVFERYYIEIPSSLLSKMEIPVLARSFNSEIAINSIKTAAEQSIKIEKEWKALAAKRIEVKRNVKKQLDSNFMPRFYKDIRIMPKDISGDSLAFENNPNRSVDKLTAKKIKEGTAKISGSNKTKEGNRRIVRYYFNQEQLQILNGILQNTGNQNPTLSQQTIDEILSLGAENSTQPKPTYLINEKSHFEEFLTQTRNEVCASSLLENVNTPANSNSGNNEENELIEELTTSKLNKKLDQILSDIDSPLGILKVRPGQEDVMGNINAFNLSPGPADVPAFFDFNQLHIAFDHVWKEFLDENIEPLVQEAYFSIIEKGGNPTISSSRGKNALDVLENEIRLIRAAGIFPPPTNLYAHKISISAGALTDEFGGLGVYDPGFQPPYDPVNPPPDNSEPPQRPRDRFDDLPVSTVGDENLKVEREPTTLIGKLRNILKGKYSFTAFGADNKSHAINFGIVVTYRQRWEPVAYQVGELQNTITLAPGESRKYSKKTKLTRKRVEKEVAKNSSILKDEFDVTNRAESEIIRKARSKTNFNVQAEGTYNFGIASGDSTTTVDNDMESSSDDAKKSFREAVVKSSQEYKQERTLEFTSEESFDFEESESGEISNPNNELTVTYLFFELQRRFRITEKIYKATPVVLVAQDIPKPNQIDESFLIRHGWILKRVLLDDVYESTLKYVAGPLAGDLVQKQALYAAMKTHESVVDTLKEDLYAMKEQASEGYEALRKAVEKRINEMEEEDTDGLFRDIGDFFGGGGQSVEGAQAREEAARAHEQRAVEKVKELTMNLQREVSAYNEATEKYTRALKKYHEWELRIVDLLLHIKENIIHYMQAIWAYEHPDQRFLRLQYIKAPGFVNVNGGAQYQFIQESDLTIDEYGEDNIQTNTAVEFEFTPNFDVNMNDKTLNEIANLDVLLGFKGNYMIFPLKDSNPLTDFMLAPFVDSGFNLMDPHHPGNISRDDFAKYVCYLRKNLDDNRFEQIRPALLRRFKELLLSNYSNGDEIIVPTGSAYIEALPGANPLLEDFKLAHRAMDLVSAKESAREASIENIRRASLILNMDLSDPDIDAKYVFEGNGSATIVPPPQNGN